MLLRRCRLCHSVISLPLSPFSLSLSLFSLSLFLCLSSPHPYLFSCAVCLCPRLCLTPRPFSPSLCPLSSSLLSLLRAAMQCAFYHVMELH